MKTNRKRNIRMFPAILCLALLCTSGTVFNKSALSEEARPYTPEEIDLSSVTAVDGRLKGEVYLPKISKLPLKIDCPIPASFAAEQSRRITVDYRKITKQQLQGVLKELSISADEKVGTFGQFLHNPDRIVWYEQGDFRHVAAFSLGNALWSRQILSGEKHAPALAAAKEAVGRVIDTFGCTAYAPLLSAEHYGEHLVWPFGTSGSTSDEKLKTLALRAFHKNREADGPTGDDVYVVYGLYDVLGLPVLPNATYMSGHDKYGYTQDFSAVLRGDGSLLALEINCLPIPKRSKPLTLPERSWEELLRQWIAGCFSGYTDGEEYTYQDDIFGEVTNYATYCVLTELAPCFITSEKFELEPGYQAVIEQRVQRDDSLAAYWTHHTDALTLTKNEY